MKKCLMHRRQSIIPNSQAPILMKPCNRTLDYPAAYPQVATMRRMPFGDLVANTTTLQCSSERFAVVSAICLHTKRLATWTSFLACHRRYPLHQWQQLGYVMPIGLCQNDADWRALRIDKEVVFAARFPTIGGIRSSFFPPCTARMVELSAITREKSSLSAPRSLESNTRCRLAHTPAFCHARNRRQQVMPEPHPISLGSIPHGIPDCKTNRIPVSTRLSSSLLRPGYLLRRRGLGSNGSTISHNSSSTSSRAITPPACGFSNTGLTPNLSFCYGLLKGF